MFDSKSQYEKKYTQKDLQNILENKYKAQHVEKFGRWLDKANIWHTHKPGPNNNIEYSDNDLMKLISTFSNQLTAPSESESTSQFRHKVELRINAIEEEIKYERVVGENTYEYEDKLEEADLIAEHGPEPFIDDRLAEVEYKLLQECPLTQTSKEYIDLLHIFMTHAIFDGYTGNTKLLNSDEIIDDLNKRRFLHEIIKIDDNDLRSVAEAELLDEKLSYYGHYVKNNNRSYKRP